MKNENRASLYVGTQYVPHASKRKTKKMKNDGGGWEHFILRSTQQS